MGRPSNREQKRREIAAAFERALSIHGLGGATITAVAEEAGCAPGLIHHHFEDREDLVSELVRSLMGRFRSELPEGGGPRDFLEAYVDRALALRPAAGRTAAKAWVGVFAEAVRSERVGAVLQRALRKELSLLARRFREAGLSESDAEARAAGLLAGIAGCLVLGALMPKTATGFAAPFVRESLAAVLRAGR